MPPPPVQNPLAQVGSDRAGLASAYAAAWRVTHNRDLASEAVQEAFLCLYRGTASYSATRGEFGPWLRTIVHHRAVDLLRKNARFAATAPLHQLATQQTSEPGPEDVVCSSDETARVRHAMTQLSEAKRQVLVLAYYYDYTYNEIALVLAVPLGTVKTRAKAGKLELRRLLGDRS